jgi:hypothetical protein
LSITRSLLGAIAASLMMVLAMALPAFAVDPTDIMVTYSENGALSGDVPAAPTAYPYGTSIVISDNTGGLALEGNVFGGWTTGTAIYQPGDSLTLTKDLTLKAVWIPVYAIAYDSNEGTSGVVPVDSYRYAEGAAATVSVDTGNLVKGSETLTGWNTMPDGTGTAYALGAVIQMGDTNVTLYAQYATIVATLPDYNSITYFGNGNTDGDVPVDSTHYPMVPAIIIGGPGNATIMGNTEGLMKDGLYFAGWNTKSDGTGIAYQPGDTLNLYASLTLYAIWHTPYHITYSLNKIVNTGTPPSDATAYCDGDMAKVLSSQFTSKYEGGYYYTNGGWNTMPDGSGISYQPDDFFEITGDTTLYVNWVDKRLTDTETKYYVHYRGNGNTGGTVPVDAGHATFGSVTTQGNIGNLVREGYVFAGWRYDSTTVFFPGDIWQITSTDVSLYATWVPTFTLSYDGNGANSGSAPAAATEYIENAKDEVLGNTGSFTKTGLFFENWNTRADGSGISYETGDAIVISESTTLYAQYVSVYSVPPIDPISIKSGYINYNANGGSGTGPTDNLRYNAGDIVTLAETQGDYNYYNINFLGWALTPNGSPIKHFVFPNGVSSVTVYAIWDGTYDISVRINTTLTYYGNGEQGGYVPVDESVYEVDDTFTVKANEGYLFKKGYRFNGWNTMPDGTGLTLLPGETVRFGDYSHTTNSVDKLYLYAMWLNMPDYYSVIYEAAPINGGTVGGMIPSDGLGYEVGDVITVASDAPTCTGATFVGWNTKADGSGTTFHAGESFYFTKTSNLTLYALFVSEPPIYMFYESPDLVSGSLPYDAAWFSKGYTAGATTVLAYPDGMSGPSNTFFYSWNTKADGSGTDYMPGATYTFGATSTTLYGQWHINPGFHSVTYNGNGNTSGTVSINKAGYATGDTLILADNSGSLARTGFAFSGWEYDNHVYSPGDIVTIGDEDAVINAVWVSNTLVQSTYKLIFDGSGATSGSVPADATAYSTGAAIILPDNTGGLVKNGYVFDGWRDGLSHYIPGDIYTMTSIDNTLYAVWREGKTVTYTGNEQTSGFVPIDAGLYLQGDTVAVSGNVNALAKTDSMLAGWWTNGQLYYLSGSSLTMGADSITLSAVWTPLALAPPVVTAVTPSHGAVLDATNIEITGTNFSGATNVTIGDIPVSSFVVNSDTLISAVTPMVPPLLGNLPMTVAVTTPGGVSTDVVFYTFDIPAPVITAISPTHGEAVGGTIVEITGANLSGTTSVTIGGQNVTDITINSDTSITVTTPLAAPDMLDLPMPVVVTNAAGFSTESVFFTYDADVTPPVVSLPSITTISPSYGSVMGGASITITGANFTSATAVTFGGVSAAYTVDSDTQITAITPMFPPLPDSLPVAVAVTTPSGVSTESVFYTYEVLTPVVTAISPTHGSVLGGTLIEITGANFMNATAVTIGSQPLTNVIINSDTSITAITPPMLPLSGELTQQVVVTSASGASTESVFFTYDADVTPPAVSLPSITMISPTHGEAVGGTIVEITGANLSGTTSVTIGGQNVTDITINSDTSITVTTPLAAPDMLDLPMPVVVTNAAGFSTESVFFTYDADVTPPAVSLPSITTISPTHGEAVGGTIVEITGANLSGTTSVTIGGQNVTDITINSDTSITVTTPLAAPDMLDLPMPVVVTNAAGFSTESVFYVYDSAVMPPAITTISPSHGSALGGTSIEITGTNFLGTSVVTIGGQAVTSFTYNSPTSITAITPPIPTVGGELTQQVVVTSMGGASTESVFFTYDADVPPPVVSLPSITTISPSYGSVMGGASITITGANFTSATAVTFGGVSAAYTVDSDTQITAITPMFPPLPDSLPVAVAVTTPSGVSTETVYFNYMPQAFNVSIGTFEGGTVIADPVYTTAGTTVALVVIPDSGKRLKEGSLQYDDGTIHAITGSSFTMPASDVTVGAVFETIPAIKYQVNIGAIEGGTVTANPVYTTAGATVALVVIPDDGKRLKEGSLQYDDGALHAIVGSSFIMPASDVTVRAVFEALPESITDAEMALADKETLTIGYGLGDSADSVTQNLTLAVSGIRYGSKITYVSSQPSIIANNGVVTRPIYANGDVQVAITATIQQGRVTETKVFEVVVRCLAQPVHTVTFADWDGAVLKIQAVKEGESATAPANPSRSKYTFIGWSAGFENITSNLTLTAQYRRNNNDATATDGSNAATGNSGTTANEGNTQTGIDPPSTSQTASTTVKATTNSAGLATVSVSQSQLTAMINSAEEVARQREGITATAEIKVEAEATARTVEAAIPKAAIEAAANSSLTALSVSTPIAMVTFDSKALDTIAGAAEADLKISASKVDTTLLDETAKAAVGSRPVYQFGVSAGSKTISEFGGRVTVSVPYTPSEGENINAIVIYYINESGMPEAVRDCHYDPATGSVVFSTSHFSVYAVGYNKVAFADVTEDAWYKNAVDAIAARGIAAGTGNGSYMPNQSLTRGEGIVMLMKAFDLPLVDETADNFDDAGNSYYTPYLAAAKKLGIIAGTGDNRYAPTTSISRQEWFVILYKTLQSIDKLPSEKTDLLLSSYRDPEEIAPWATEAMQLFVQTGILSGDNGYLKPEAAVTRAEAAQILYNVIFK